MYSIFTIGHSNHTLERFIDLLQNYGISCLVDVRSVPRSKLYPQFNLEVLRKQLRPFGITYLHFGEEFGARSGDINLLNIHGQVDFDKVRSSNLFRRGIDRLKDGLKREFTIALMCAEAEPINCHRFSMISYQLVREEINVFHVLKSGKVKENKELEKDLVEWYRSQLESPLFNAHEYHEPNSVSLEKAYLQKNLEIGFSPTDDVAAPKTQHDKVIYDRIHQ